MRLFDTKDFLKSEKLKKFFNTKNTNLLHHNFIYHPISENGFLISEICV